MANEKQKMTIDLSHHLSDSAKARKPSPLKGLQKYHGKAKISMAGGMPNAAYFPFSSISADVLVPDSFPATTNEPASTLSWFWKLFSTSPSHKEKLVTLSIPKYPANPDDISLSTLLQYGPSVGNVRLMDFINNFTAKVYQPAYEGWSTLSHIGNTDGLYRALITLCNRGEGILTEKWTYPSAVSTMDPLGLTPVPIEIDGEGMRSDSLRKILSEWDTAIHGMPRPHVMYTVPVGQNPCGMTMGAERKKEIHDICVEYDIIIIEDDPYYFLQEGVYIPKTERNGPNVINAGDEEAKYIASLVPSYLKMDYQGRVIRLDTFSKTVAPGSRLGWFTCCPLFAERLERQGETSTQAPCGYSQALITTILTNWKYEGYIRWLKGLGIQYTLRRDNFIDCLHDEFQMERSVGIQGVRAGRDVYTAYKKHRGRQDEKCHSSEKPMFSLLPPTSGMFVWLKLHFENHPRFGDEGEESLEMKLFAALAEAGVLFAPGFYFSPDRLSESDGGREEEGHFRIAFSNSEPDEMKKAASILKRVLTEFFNEGSG